jgi:hypothetical protein
LGQVSVAALGTAVKVVATGFPLAIDQGYAMRAIERERGKGILGLGQEQIEWCGLVWVPCLLLALGCSSVDGRIRKRTKHSTVFNLYEALDGKLLNSGEQPRLDEVNLSPYRLPPRAKSRTLQSEICQAFEKWRTVVQNAARQRWTTAAKELGIPLPIEALTVSEIAPCHLPVYVGILESKGKRRAVAASGASGNAIPRLSTILTSNMNFLLGALNS